MAAVMPSSKMKNGPVHGLVACIRWERLLGYERCHPARDLMCSSRDQIPLIMCLYFDQARNVQRTRQDAWVERIPVQRCSRQGMRRQGQPCGDGGRSCPYK